jgi:1-acyl-sn-glycerol-3-phosphate acyltransferase
MKKFGIGGARLAVDSGYPVLPVAHNAGSNWPKDGFIKHPGVIMLKIGAKIPTTDKTAAEINQAVYAWMQAEMTELEGQQPSLDS